MTDKKFNAILAKNQIARELATATTEGINVRLIQSCLNDIEAYIGEGNQPSVSEIIGNNTDSEKQFDI